MGSEGGGWRDAWLVGVDSQVGGWRGFVLSCLEWVVRWVEGVGACLVGAGSRVDGEGGCMFGCGGYLGAWCMVGLGG